jgi:hypothetical protein
MKLLSNVFQYGEDKTYIHLADVLEYSAKKNSPNTPLVMTRIKAPLLKAAKKAFDSNNHKFTEWVRAMDQTDDDVILIDADMIIIRDLSDAFDDQSFDIGLTALPGFERLVRSKSMVRPGKIDGMQDRLPFNGGVVMVRNNQAARAFIHKWHEIDQLMYSKDKALHNRYRAKYAGMNQASLGWMFENYKEARIKFFDCREWNHCRDKWIFDKSKVRILHIKSKTRKSIFLPTPIKLLEYYIRPAVMEWRKYANESGIIEYPTTALFDIGVERPGVGGFVMKRNPLIRRVSYGKR